jgi:tetratricopeptide (TPR) repeat protein
MSNGNQGTSHIPECLLAFRQTAPGPDCPDRERLEWLAAGLVEAGEAQELLDHAATCDCCGGRLREAVQDLGKPLTREELALAAASRMADPRRRRAFARRLAGTRRRGLWDWLRRPSPLWLAPAGALATLLAVSGAFLMQGFNSLAAARRLTNRACAASRVMPLRFAAVDYAAVTTERGGEASHLSQPAVLFEAEARVKRGVDAHPNDPLWLDLEGRLDLLNGKEDAAIAELERAHALRPRDPYILSDLGAAHYQKAEKAGDDAQEYAAALAAFSKGLALKSNDPVLLFNKALTAEQMHAFGQAQAAWRAYLQADPRGRWAQEGRTHLESIRSKPGR